MRWGRGDGRHGVHRSPASLLSFFLSEFIPYEVPYESQLPFETLSCLISLSTFHQSVSTNVPSSLMSPCVLPAHNPRHCQSRQRGSRYNFVLPPVVPIYPCRAGKVHTSYNSTSNGRKMPPVSPTGDARLGKLFSVCYPSIRQSLCVRGVQLQR
jgi:hypothetical protein